MNIKYLSRLPKAQALELIRGGLVSLRVDHQMNIDLGTFDAWPGAILNFEEFMMMLLLDKDFALKLQAKRG